MLGAFMTLRKALTAFGRLAHFTGCFGLVLPELIATGSITFARSIFWFSTVISYFNSLPSVRSISQFAETPLSRIALHQGDLYDPIALNCFL